MKVNSSKSRVTFKREENDEMEKLIDEIRGGSDDDMQLYSLPTE